MSRVFRKLISFLLLLLTCAPVPAVASLERAHEARLSGDYAAAVAIYESVLTDQPDSHEALLNLGVVLGWDGQFDRSLSVLDEGLSHHPRSIEMQLARARTLSWKGDFSRASDQLEAVLEQDPANQDARILQGRMLGWQERYDAAERTYQEVLESDPDSIDALEGMGDLFVWRERFDEARTYYEAALARDPDSAALQRKLQNIEDLGPWRLDAGIRFGSYRRGDRPDWKGAYLTLGYRLNTETGIWLGMAMDERFNATDWSYEAGISHRFGDDLSASLAYAWSPDARFTPRNQLRGNVTWRVRDHRERPSFLLVDPRVSRYRDGTATSIPFGIRQYLNQNWYVTLRLIPTRNLDSRWTYGCSAQVNWRVSEAFQVYAGTARGRESIDRNPITLSSILQTRAYFAGAAFEFNPRWSARLDYIHEETVGSVILDLWHVGITRRFWRGHPTGMGRWPDGWPGTVGQLTLCRLVCRPPDTRETQSLRQSSRRRIGRCHFWSPLRRWRASHPRLAAASARRSPPPTGLHSNH